MSDEKQTPPPETSGRSQVVGGLTIRCQVFRDLTRIKTLKFLLLAVLLCSCAGPRHVSATKFMEEYAWVGQPQTMHTVTYLGQRDGRAFISRRSMSTLNPEKWSDQIIYVHLAELDPAFRNSLPNTQMKERR